MKPVTTGPGISGTFADVLDSLVCDFRAQVGNDRWHLYIHVLRSPEYSFRVYAPDGHTGLHTVTMTSETADGIRQILWDEAESWQSRVREVALRIDEPAGMSN